LTTDLNSSARQLLQIYFDRWQIEVNHREEKDTLGVGQAQLRNITSVPKQPVLCVAAYSALLLTSFQAFGAERGHAYQGTAQMAAQGPPLFLSRPRPAPAQGDDGSS
jgi:hypothetical protein